MVMLLLLLLLLPSVLLIYLWLAEAAVLFERPSESRGWSRGQQVLISPEEVLAPGSSRDVYSNGQQHPQHAVGFVAFGDSYSAGIGTGVDGVENDCRLGSHAHPVLIFTDLAESQGASATTFQFLSCTGSTTGNVLSGGERSQIDSFNTSINADFAILSIGGNDLGFFRVMNACIFRFYSFYSGTCETALQYVADQIESSEFEHRLAMVIMEILDKVQWEKRPWFVVNVTGYARFFSVETDECDNCTLGVWWQGPKLKRDVRQRMNDMVVAVNAKLKRSIDAVNSRYSAPKVLFVDYDARFDGHRFCEPNVTEPAYNRTETWFFLVGGKDNNPDVTDPTPAPNSTSNKVDVGRGRTLSPLSPLADPDTCLDPAERSGDWGLLALCYMARAKRDDSSLRFAREEVMIQDSMWYVPTYYGKAFHPRSLGHEAVRDEVYRTWSSLGIPAWLMPVSSR